MLADLEKPAGFAPVAPVVLVVAFAQEPFLYPAYSARYTYTKTNSHYSEHFDPVPVFDLEIPVVVVVVVRVTASYAAATATYAADFAESARLAGSASSAPVDPADWASSDLELDLDFVHFALGGFASPAAVVAAAAVVIVHTDTHY